MNPNDDNSRDKLDDDIKETEQHQSDPTQTPNVLPNQKDPTATSDRPTPSSSSPIDIRQSSCGKFGVLQARPPAPDSAHGLMIDSSTGEPVPIDKLIKTANTMSSMMMAHKIALEDDFRLEPGMDISGPLMSLSPIIGSSPSRNSSTGGQQQQEPSLHSRVKDIVHEAYWDLFKEELTSQTSETPEEGRKYDISKQLLCDVKQKIVELLLPQHGRLKQDIEDKLDGQIIDQLARIHSLNLKEYAHYILSVLSKLCAPVRDERLKELADMSDIVQLYRGIMEMLELMRLDFANFTLNQFKPHIKAHSQDYEREKFTEILKQQRVIGIDGLEYTKVWLARAVERVDAIHGIAELVNETTTVTLDQELEDNSIKTAASEEERQKQRIIRADIVNKVLNVAYCELLEWTPKTQKMYPETLLFDEATFKQLSEQYKVLLLTASILLTTFAFVKSFKLQDNNEFKVLVKSHIITLLTATYDQPAAAVRLASHPSNNNNDQVGEQPSLLERLDSVKLETVTMKLCDDIRQTIQETSGGSGVAMLELFENQKDLLKGQIVDLQNSSNRIRELARRRILEFVETLLDLDVKHQQNKFPSRMPPPVNIPLGLNCLTDEITLTMAQLVKIIRYNRRVFFQHYENIITEQVSKLI